MRNAKTDRETVERLIRREPMLTSMPPQETEVAKTLRALLDERDAAVARAEAAEAKLTHTGATYVCPICDIAGCEHTRAALKERGRGPDQPRPRIVTEPVAAPPPHTAWRAYSPERRDLGSVYADNEEKARDAFRAALGEGGE